MPFSHLFEKHVNLEKRLISFDLGETTGFVLLDFLEKHYEHGIFRNPLQLKQLLYERQFTFDVIIYERCFKAHNTAGLELVGFLKAYTIEYQKPLVVQNPEVVTTTLPYINKYLPKVYESLKVYGRNKVHVLDALGHMIAYLEKEAANVARNSHDGRSAFPSL